MRITGNDTFRTGIDNTINKLIVIFINNYQAPVDKWLDKSYRGG